jgi:hypothetical protein
MHRSHATGNKDCPMADDESEEQPLAGPASPNARSGDFSHDPALDPDQLFDVIGREENAERVSAAMRAFLARGDTVAFERAVAIFVRSARARGDPVERVLAVLIGLAEEREGVPHPHDRTPTDLRWVVLRGVLRAFYGDTSGTEGQAGSNRRRGDGRG